MVNRTESDPITRTDQPTTDQAQADPDGPATTTPPARRPTTLGGFAVRAATKNESVTQRGGLTPTRLPGVFIGGGSDCGQAEWQEEEEE